MDFQDEISWSLLKYRCKSHLLGYFTRLPRGVFASLCLWIVASTEPAAGGEPNAIYNTNFNTCYPVWQTVSGFGNFGYNYQPEHFSQYRIGWPGFIDSVYSGIQIWAGLDSYYTENYQEDNRLELRPFGGMKFNYESPSHINFYNLTRYEYRCLQNQSTDEWSGYGRIRSRFGVTAPIAPQSEAWNPKTFYLLADLEPFYRFDKNAMDPFRMRAGFGYVYDDRIRVELIYTANFNRNLPGDSLEFQNNRFEINIRLGLEKGLMRRIFNSGD